MPISLFWAEGGWENELTQAEGPRCIISQGDQEELLETGIVLKNNVCSLLL